MSEALGQIAVVGEKEKPFSLCVEPADAEKPGKFCRQQVEDRVAGVKIFSSRNEPRRLVQHDCQRRIDTHHFAIHFHVIGYARLHAEVSANLPINGDAPRGN